MKNKSETKKIIRKTYKNFIFNIKEVATFEVYYRLIALFLFIPINLFILNKFMGNTGVFNITNKDLLKFILTFNGAFYFILIMIVSFIAIFIEMAVLTYVAAKSYNGIKVKISEAVINSIKVMPNTLGTGIIVILLVAGVIGPLTGIGLCSSLIKKLKIPSFVTIELFKTLNGKIIYGVFIFVLIVLLLRWILAIPCIIIEKVSINKAIKNSIKIYKAKKWRILGYLILWILATSIINVLGPLLYTTIGAFVIYSIGVNSVAANVFMWIFVVLFFILYVIISLIAIPAFVSFTVELYYSYRNYDAEERNFGDYKKYINNRIYNTVIKYKALINTIVIIVFISMILIRPINEIFKEIVNKDVKVTAHRGSSLKAPENSLSSIKKAVEDGADYAEIDVMTTLDGKVVLFHDNNLKRINRTNRAIRDMTLEEVKTVDNGSYFSSEFNNEKIPTLDEILEYAKGKIKLNIELKPHKKDDLLEKKVSELIKNHDMTNDVVITSLNYDSLQEIKKYNPALTIGYIVSVGLGDFTKLNVDFLSVEDSMLKSKLVYAMHALGKEVHVWTLNDDYRIEEAIYMGVDNIITDNVESVEYVKSSMNDNGDTDYLSWFYEIIYTIMDRVTV